MAVTYRKTPECMIPIARDLQKYHREYEDDKHYTLEEIRERSLKSHNTYFAAVHLTWLNRPEIDRQLFPTEDHWREFCLIKAGFCKERVWIVPADPQEFPQFFAQVVDWTSSLKKNFVVTTTEGNITHVLYAKTQKMLKNDPDGMDKKDFEASKNAVLEICATQWPGLMTVDQLLEEAKRQMG